MSRTSTCRVAIASHEPLLRDGLKHIVADAAAEVVACVPTIEELDAGAEPFDVLVAQVESGFDARELAGACGPGTRIVAVHDALSPMEVDVALSSGVSTMVDTSAAPSVLLDAVVGTRAGTRLRWSRPAIGPMPLTERQCALLALVASGRTASEVAAELGVSVRTVEKNKQVIFEQLGVQNQAHAVAIAVRAGMLQPVPTVSGSAR